MSLKVFEGSLQYMGDGRIFYVGGKVGAKPRAWGKEKSILLNIKRVRKLKY